MKFTCTKEQLDRQLQHISRIITLRHSMPVLANVLIETDADMIRISGTDLELSMTTTVPASVEQQGAFTVPAKVFQEFIHQNPDEQVTVTLEGNELVCTSKKVRGRIAGMDPEEYPSLPTIEEKHRISLPTTELTEVLRQVVIACANDQARPVLTGIQVTFDGEQATFAATDSFRLAEKSLKITPQPEPLTLLIPARTVQECIRVAGQVDSGENTEFIIGEKQVVVRVGGIDLHSRLLAGNFPKYQALIPTEAVAVADVPTSEMVQALRLASVFSQTGIANITLEVDAEGALTVTSYGSQRGTTSHTVYAVVEEGFQPIKAAFNARFLLDACGATGADHVQLRFKAPTAPLVLKTEEEGYVQLVMPLLLDA